MNVLKLLSCLTFLGCISGILAARKAHIIEGALTNISEYPYQAGIQMFYSFTCGAAIINEYYLLSAAHCVNISEFEQDKNGIVHEVVPTVLRAVVGLQNRYNESDGVVHEIDKLTYHEKFGKPNVPAGDSDISLIRLKKPIKFNENTRKIGLCTKEPKATDSATVTGYGQTTAFRMDGSEGELRVINIAVIGRDTCKSIFKKKYNSVISSNMICAGLKSSKKGSCHGDSGGPLVVKNRLAGVVSWGEGCGRAGEPGIYTSVYKYLTWIKEKMALMGGKHKNRITITSNKILSTTQPTITETTPPCLNTKTKKTKKKKKKVSKARQQKTEEVLNYIKKELNTSTTTTTSPLTIKSTIAEEKIQETTIPSKHKKKKVKYLTLNDIIRAGAKERDKREPDSFEFEEDVGNDRAYRSYQRRNI